MKVGFYSDCGKVRDNNEDYLLIDLNEQVFIIADGMGGYDGGEIASKTTCEHIMALLLAHLKTYQMDSHVADLMVEAIESANQAIYKMSQEDPRLNGMGTTVVVAVKGQSKVLIAHVGDSRAYWVTDHVIQQLTKDHSLVQELVDSGSITEDEAKKHPKRNVITRAIGSETPVMPEVLELSLETPGVLMLTTDGVTSLISDEIILETITQHEDLQMSAHRLVDLANEKGGTDNSTVILVKIDPLDF